jgi:hypothetical protein
MDRTVHMPWEVTAGGKSYTLPAGYRVKVRDSQPWHETVILEFLWPPGTDFDDTIWAPVLATDVDRYTDVIMTPKTQPNESFEASGELPARKARREFCRISIK